MARRRVGLLEEGAQGKTAIVKKVIFLLGKGDIV